MLANTPLRALRTKVAIDDGRRMARGQELHYEAEHWILNFFYNQNRIEDTLVSRLARAGAPRALSRRKSFCEYHWIGKWEP